MELKRQSQLKFARLAAGYLAILVALLGIGFFLNSQFERLLQQQEWVRHTNQVLMELELSVGGIKDAETGARGFMLLGQESYLAPYLVGSVESRDHVRKLIDIVQDNPVQKRRAEVLQELIEQRLRIFEEVIKAKRSGADTQKIVVGFIDQGKSVMDNLREQVRIMKDDETRLLDSRTAEAEKTRQFFMYSLFASTVLSILILSAAFMQFRRSDIKQEEELRANQHLAWIRENVAEVSRLSSGEQATAKIGDQILSYLSHRTETLAAKMFLLEKGKLEMVSSWGVDHDPVLANQEFKKTLLMEALQKDGIWEIKDLPHEYWKIKSGLGSAKPKNLLFVPLKFQGQPFGLMELASFTDFSPEQKEMIDKITEVLAINLNSAQSRSHLQVLLEETQTQAEELQSQQEELRTNNEELEQQARALEGQQESMNIKNKELEGIRRMLENKAKELEAASQYKSEFLAKMSHELRTPLNGLLILSSLLFENKEKNLTEQQRQFAKSIYNAGNDLLTLINDILDLSKIEARKLRLSPEKFSLVGCLDQLRTVFEPQAKSKGLELELEISKELQDTAFFTDRQRLEQILRNFLSNAVKFTDQGRIDITARLAAHSRDEVIISVKDSGVGIPAAKQALIFEAFEQADSSVSRRFGGTGLGLTISRELAALLGAEISVESQEGQGSTFSIRIPLNLGPQAQAENAAGARTPLVAEPPRVAAPAAEKNAKSAGHAIEAQRRIDKLKPNEKTLLIVEDDPKFSSSVAEAASAYGFQPLQIEDGDLALSVLHKFVPDAILLDIKLPGISGMGLLEVIKTMPQLRHVPVHMISAMDYQLNALRMGALGYLTKPVTIEKVRSALERIDHLLTGKVRRVLLIEDDERQTEAISSLIAGQDVEVMTASNGAKAIEILKKGNIDCIILDLTLPDVSGMDLLSELNSLQISLPPVVIYTGKDLSHDEEAKLRQYSQSIIIKGARSPERLLDEVNLFLHRVESMLPEDKREMLVHLRSQDKTFEGKSILLVDDDLRNLFALTSALESRGLQVRAAKNGLEALEIMDESGQDVDLVLMDIMMPKMDGYEAIRRIRANPNSAIKKVPIIALTAKAMREDHEKCIEVGASDYLTKPVNLENLFTSMKVWLSEENFFA